MDWEDRPTVRVALCWEGGANSVIDARVGLLLLVEILSCVA